MLQDSPLEDTTIFTMLYTFPFADVSARKNFACIYFGDSVDSCRQVK